MPPIWRISEYAANSVVEVRIHAGPPLTSVQFDAVLVGTMFDWHVQAHRDGKPHDHPTTQPSAEAAIEAGNSVLQKAFADEVTVYHRLYSNQASLSFSKAIPTDEIRQKAEHLEKQAQQAAKDG